MTGKIKYKIEKVGPFKKLAKRAYQKKMVEWAEKKYLDIKEESNLTFSQLVKWFLDLPVVRQNKTIKDIERACRDLEKVFGPILVKEVKPAMVEKFQRQRLQEPTRQGKPRSAANVNRTIAVMKRMFNLAVREELADKNPCWKGAGEIFNLTWDRVDLTNRVIRLEAKDTKTAEPRVVFLCDEAYDMLKKSGKVRLLEHNSVFIYKGKPLKKIKKALPNACSMAGISNFRFHDLRHTFNTNMRKAGVDHSVIMKLTGHKTPSMFQRYNTVELDDAKNAYQKLEALLRKDQGRGSAPAEKCSHSAPEG